MRLLSDSELATVERDPNYKRFKGKCPTCDGTGQYHYRGEWHDCPDDDYGHVQLRLFKLYALANLPLEHCKLDWHEYPQVELKPRIEKYIENFDTIRKTGYGWNFVGKDYGIGKTWGACHTLKELVKAGYSGYFVYFNDLKGLWDRENRKDRDALVERIRGSEVLVIDDILKPYTDKQGAFYSDQLESVLRYRTSANLPTFTTTNLDRYEMDSWFPRVHSLLSGKQFHVMLEGDDWRQEVYRKLEREQEEAILNGDVAPLT